MKLTYEQCLELAELAHAAKLHPDKTLDQLRYLSIKAYTDGENPSVYFSEGSIVKGKFCFSAAYIASRIKRSGYSIIARLTDQDAHLTFMRDGLENISTFTMADAKKAGLGGHMYEKFPRNMLYARALTNGARWFCQEVFGQAVYTPDELQDTGEPEDKPKPYARKSFLKAAAEANKEDSPKDEPKATPKTRRLTADQWAALKAYPSGPIIKWLNNQTNLSPLDRNAVEDLITEKKMEEAEAQHEAMTDAEEGVANEG